LVEEGPKMSKVDGVDGDHGLPGPRINGLDEQAD
jgi:hypothetical protein